MSTQLLNLLHRLGQPRIGVVGDLMLDEYVWGEVERISPEAPIPVLRVSRREVRVGGAGSVAVNLARLEAGVHAFALVGDDPPGEQVVRLLEKEMCDISRVVRDPARRTTVKTRNMGYVQQAHRAVQQMLRVDEEDLRPLDPELLDRLLEGMSALAGSLDAVLVSDYNKGLVTWDLVQGIRTRVGSTPVLVDPARIEDYSRYEGVSLISPNRFEAERASGIECRHLAGCEKAAERLSGEFDIAAVAITLDRDGIYLRDARGRGRHFPTRARVVADVTGAGDMVLALLGLVSAAGGGLEDAVRLANVAAGIEVRYFGVHPVSREELRQELEFQGHPVALKVKSLRELERVVEEAHEAGKTVVLTNGCFDLLHPGHHHLLNGARREGDLLIVAVNSDASIRRLKGTMRPRIAEDDRVKMLAGMEAVDYVVVFDDDTPNGLLEALRPDVLVKGSEYRDGTVVGRDIIEGYGGRVAFVEQLPGFSTSRLLGEPPRD